MKKSLYIIGMFALAVLATGCHKEDATKGNLIELTLTTVASELETKTHFGEKGEDGTIAIEWDGNDQIVTGKGTTKYCLDNKVAGPTAIFKGSVGSEVQNSSTLNYGEIFIYPSSVVTGEFQDGYIARNIIFKNEQVLTADSYDPTANVAAAMFDIQGEAEEIYFKNLCAILAVELTGNAEIKSIEINASGNNAPKYLTGVHTVLATDRNKVGSDATFTVKTSTNDSGKENVILKADSTIGLSPDNGVTEGTKRFYACVCPKGTNNGVKVEGNLGLNKNAKFSVKITDRRDWILEVKDITVKNDITAGQIYVIGKFTNVNTDKFTDPAVTE